MLSIHQTLSLPYFRLHKARTALIITSIALGVATLVATRALNESMTLAVGQSVTPLAGVADLLVSNGEQGVHDSVLRDLQRSPIPGVKYVQPLILDRVALPDLENRTALLIGVDLESEAVAGNPRGITLEFSNPPTSVEEIRERFEELRKVDNIGVVGVGKELNRALKPESRVVRVRAAGKEWHLVKAGTIDASGPAATLGGSVLVMRLYDAAMLRGRPDIVSRIDIALESGADRQQVMRLVKERVGIRSEVKTTDANDAEVESVIGTLQLGFSLGGAGALVVGLFLVYNALAVSVADRRHDIGILRSLGATRAQVAALFAGESILLGIVGAVLGVPLGLGLAQISLGPIRGAMSDVFLPLESVQLPITMANIVTSVLAGVVVALLAGLIPAIQAAREEPADTVRRVPFRASWVYRAMQAGASVLTILAGLLCIAIRGQLESPRIGTFGGLILVLTGTLLATPFLAAVAARLLGPICRQLLGIEGRLAADNLARSPGRTGLVIAALAAGVALLIQTAGLTVSSKAAVLDWVDRTMSADLFVFANSSLGGVGESQPMDEKLVDLMETMPVVNAAAGSRFQRIPYRDVNQKEVIVYLIAADSTRYYAAEQDRPARPGRDLYPRLREPGAAILSDNFSSLRHVPVGQSFSLQGPQGPVAMQGIGNVPYYAWNQGAVIVDRGWYRQQFGDRLVDRVDIYLKPGSDPKAARESILRHWGAEHGLVVMTREEMHDAVEATISRLYGMFYAQNMVIGLVAALGVVMALLISVLQRRRELGLLRAVGASRGQILLSVLVEAALMGIIGAAIGLLVGVPIEWYVLKVIMLEETGFAFPVRIPWREAALVGSVAFATATIAGLGPAVHAMRMRIAEAIAYE